MKDKKNLRINFNFDDLQILAGEGNSVIFKGIYFDDSEKYSCKTGDCIIYMPRNSFSELFNAWIDKKKEYYKAYNHFCGVGSVYLGDIHEIIEKNYLTYDGVDKEIPTFFCTTFEIDMEHG